MKASDIQKIQEAGLITSEQGHAIVQHFQLETESRRFLVILSVLGGILVSGGVILLVASNWEEIPRLMKVTCGLALLVAAHFGGWWLGREGRHSIPAAGLRLVGSGLFLANIGLIGQVYNLSSRPPNALLLWCAGIAPLPWILRSKTQLLLMWIAFGTWIGMELEQPDSLIYFDGEARLSLFYALLGILISALGVLLARTRFPEFGPATEKFGLLLLHITSYPLTLTFFYGSKATAPGAWVVCGIVSLAAVIALCVNAGRSAFVPDRQWRWTWTAALLLVLALVWAGFFWRHDPVWDGFGRHRPGLHWIATPLLFALCVLQAQVGVIRRSAWLVNTAVVFMGLHIITAYFELFGSMQTTGLFFVAGGLGLIGLAFCLEKKRRALIERFASAQT
ncbi:MAG: DUF2157 domain-containing protein [Verrucomicrobia bacterium]|nr:DUF2157 domain-containing protein [Verrucomicrobiota bacterium]MBI3868335.1 DUF2157 domain-containing protein [Verrucomicrobiota bacterium]